MNQYKIKKNSLQETLIIPLYARWLCSRKFSGLFQDKTGGDQGVYAGLSEVGGARGKTHSPPSG